ncbi:MAG: SDR family oxidoreductase [Peptococcaceae bacterium]|jgi:NAD(P)-dependent dehydrogenase (short-subunit alcohol dehydrogenase family)|nr:SDR family oxidoreductase [Peptococcaceae bacterium]
MSNKKIALISGAATGIGRAAVVRLAEDGVYDMILADWNKAELEQTAQMCKEKGAAADSVVTDMGKEAEVEALVKFAADKYGRVDFFFNNQGAIHMPKDFENITAEDMDLVIHSNFKACFFGMKHVARVMIRQKSGHILNTGSSSGLRPETGFSVYSATKHAVIGLTKVAAIEFARYNIRVNCLCPGGYITPLTVAVGQYMQEHSYAQPKSSVALLGPAKMGDVSEIVGMISALADDANTSYMTGAIVSLDGGNTL